MNYTPANDAFIRFCSENKDAALADFSCISISYDDGLRLLRERTLDLCICFVVKTGMDRAVSQCRDSGLRLEQIRDIPISVRVRKGHPLAGLLLEEPTLENLYKLNQYPYVEYANIDTVLQVYNSVSSHSFGYSYRILVSNLDMRLKMVSCTNAYTLGVYLSEERCNPYDILNINIGTETTNAVSITREDSVITEDMKRYIELLNDEFDKALGT